MADWIGGITLALAGAAGGLALSRPLWLSVIERGKIPHWIPTAIAKPYFGESSQSLMEAKRAKGENERLHKDVRHYSTLLNLAPFPVWRRDEKGLVTYCNLAYTALMEHIPERIIEEFGMELSQNSRNLAEQARKNQQPASEDLHVIVEGERQLYQLVEVPDPDLKGSVGFAVNASSREKVEEELRRHQEAQADLMEASNMATAIYDSEKRLKFFNNAYVSLWKFDRQWLLTKPTFGEAVEYLREKRRLPEMVNFQQYKQQRLKLFNDLIDPYEEILHLPDGKIVRMVIVPYALGGLIFFYEDVTDRMALERSYNTLIAVQRETLNNLHEGVAVFGEDGRLRLSNPIYQKIWGLSADFLASEPHIGEILEQTKNLYNYAEWGEFKERMITQSHVRKMSYQRIERTDGSVIDGSTVPLPDGATLITYLDVTDSTLVERSLIDKNEALREADRLKTEFLLSVSYELRSPLTSITGFSEILREKYFGDLNPKQAEYLNAIYDSAMQLGHLINNILDLASIEAGYMRLEIKEFAVADLLEKTREMVQERIAGSGQNLELVYPDNIGNLQADEIRIRQVLLNLLNNAIKFTPQGGLIRLGANTVGQSGIVLWVEDNGMGIPQDEQSSVFERFRAGALRNKRAGAGLGLAMVKNFVELHSGRIELTSEMGKGTKVSCFLPRQYADGLYTMGLGGSGSPLALAEPGVGEYIASETAMQPRRRKSEMN